MNFCHFLLIQSLRRQKNDRNDNDDDDDDNDNNDDNDGDKCCVIVKLKQVYLKVEPAQG